MMRDAEETRLHYCKKCGTSLTNHKDDHCRNTDYPALMPEFKYLMPIVKLYGLDLTEANKKCADGGRHGSEEGDIVLDIAGSIHAWTMECKAIQEKFPIKKFITTELENWGYEPEEIKKHLDKLEVKN